MAYPFVHFVGHQILRQLIGMIGRSIASNIDKPTANWPEPLFEQMQKDFGINHSQARELYTGDEEFWEDQYARWGSRYLRTLEERKDLPDALHEKLDAVRKLESLPIEQEESDARDYWQGHLGRRLASSKAQRPRTAIDDGLQQVAYQAEAARRDDLRSDEITDLIRTDNRAYWNDKHLQDEFEKILTRQARRGQNRRQTAGGQGWG